MHVPLARWLVLDAAGSRGAITACSPWIAMAGHNAVHVTAVVLGGDGDAEVSMQLQASEDQETCADIGSPQGFTALGVVSFTPIPSVNLGFVRVRWTASTEFVILSADANLSNQ